jgi:hypothetical protein
MTTPELSTLGPYGFMGVLDDWKRKYPPPATIMQPMITWMALPVEVHDEQEIPCWHRHGHGLAFRDQSSYSLGILESFSALIEPLHVGDGHRGVGKKFLLRDPEGTEEAWA